MALYTYGTSKFHPDKIRIDRHKFIPCQELTLFRTEVKKKSSSGDFTYLYKRFRGVTPRTETPAQFRDFRGATRHVDKSVDDVTIFSRLRANSDSVTYRKKKKKKKKKSGTPPYGHLGYTVSSLLQPPFFWLPAKTAIHFLVKNRRKKVTR